MPSGLLQATNENLYGTTGNSVFVITTEGQFSTLYNVAGPSGLIQATDGNFYGTAGGGNLCFLAPGIELDCGTIFGITDRGCRPMFTDSAIKQGALTAPTLRGLYKLPTESSTAPRREASPFSVREMARCSK